MRLYLCILAAALFSVSAVCADETANKNGERVYRSKCKSCHGAKGEGIDAKLAVKKKLDPDKLPLAPMADKSDDDVRKIIIDGVEKMPGFGEKLKPEQIDDVLAFCRSLVPLNAQASGE